MVFINYLRIDHSLQSNFCTFLMCFKVGSSTVLVPFPCFCCQFLPKILWKAFKVLFVFERTSKSNWDISKSLILNAQNVLNVHLLGKIIRKVRYIWALSRQNLSLGFPIKRD